MSADTPPPGDTARASDADRDAVVARLQDALADGRIDFEEFDKRMSAVTESRTFGALTPLTADLPDLRSQPRESLTLRSKGSTLVREGRWKPSRDLVVDASLCKVRLDLTEADWPGPEIAISASLAHCTLTVVVPDDTDVDTGDVEFVFSSSKGRADAATQPRRSVRIRGRVQHGKIQVSRPSDPKGFFRRRAR
ncbi:DUF1707 domain-containing protein [Actinopolymorpha pittospori]|uniref:DUF1707 domain-containing protein n=1 Tax=Actinopolymorpha pittospori TaxID=648752 RepID=A0A927N3J4_9ACTN|nr:hypothetical protein [Actinopolymorpha pittospori]